MIDIEENSKLRKIFHLGGKFFWQGFNFGGENKFSDYKKSFAREFILLLLRVVLKIREKFDRI